MSELMKAFKVTDTYEKRIPKTAFNLDDVLKFDTRVFKPNPYNTVYEVKASIYASAQWSDEAKDAEVAQYALAVKQNLIHTVFGEFKPYFRRIERALWNEDTKEAEKLLADMEHQMFEE